jgi:hypothetical protein
LPTVGERERGSVAKVVECVEAHYEVLDVEMGKVYRWHPQQSVVVECECGEELSLTASQHSDGCCGHKLLSVVPVVSMRVEGGYVGRCLLCGTTGPIRGNGVDARRVLLEQMVRDEQ